MAMPMQADAQLLGNASATGQFESNSNIFNLNSGTSQPGTNDSRRSDTFLAYGAQFDVQYLWGRQEVFASASGTDFKYQHFQALDHQDYRFDTGLNWKLGDRLDGKLDASRARTMVPFFDLRGTTLSLETQQRETALVGLKVASNWRIEASGQSATLDQPIPQAPQLRQTESGGVAAVKYLGITGFTSGFNAGYLTGKYEGVILPTPQSATGPTRPAYHQTTGNFTATYQSIRASVDGEIGYSRRASSSGFDNTSGITGSVLVKDQLTPKTDIALKLSRNINSYVLNAGSEIDSAAGVTVNWLATYKLQLSLGYTFTYRDYPGQGNNPPGSTRIDRQQAATVGIDYRPQPWLLIKPYASYLVRGSDYIGGDFDSTIFGLYVTLLTPRRAK